MPYSINDARHRFAVWAAYRATQAGSAKVNGHVLAAALKASGVMQCLRTYPGHGFVITYEQCEAVFDLWVTAVVRHVRANRKIKIAYGIGAKLVSVYAKCMVSLAGFENTALASYLPPPIDSYLLDGVDLIEGTSLSTEYKWSQLDRTRYWRLLEELREINGARPMWNLEEYWDLFAV
jgi:hypothetical protein